MLRIRTMTLDDLPLGMRLKEQAGWNQTQADWRRVLELGPGGCFVAELDDGPVGTTATCVFGQVGWLAMVLVDEALRRRGIGTRLMEHALAYLQQRGVRTARLDATPLGRPMYERLGFEAEYELARFEGAAHGAPPGQTTQPATAAKLDAICALDEDVTGTDRRKLLERLYGERPDAMRICTVAAKLAGYMTFREGSRAVQLGPGVALHEDAGRALADDALGRISGRPVFVDIPLGNRAAVQWAETSGLAVQRSLTRMRRGEPLCDRPAQVWASSGPEKG